LGYEKQSVGKKQRMQTDFWMTEETSHPEQCPLCSKPLKNGSTTCFSCGFTTHPPSGSSVWIDPTVYAYPTSLSRVQPWWVSQQTEERDPRQFPKPKQQPNPITPIPPRASAQPANAALGSIVIPNEGSFDQKNSPLGRENKRLKKNRSTICPPDEVSALESVQKNSSVWQYESPNFHAAGSVPVLSLLVSETPTQPELESRSKSTPHLPHIDEIDTVPTLKDTHFFASSRALVPITSQYNMATFSGTGDTTVNVLASTESSPSSWTSGAASQSSYAHHISSRSKRKNVRSTISLNPLDRMRWWLLRPGRIEFMLWLGGTITLVTVTCVLLLITAFSFEWLTPGSAGISSTNSAGSFDGSHQQATVTVTPGLASTGTNTGTQRPITTSVPSTPGRSSPPGVTPIPTSVASGGSGGQPTPVGQTPVPVSPTPGKTPTAPPTVTPTASPTVTPTAPPTVTPTASPAVSGSSNLGSALGYTGGPSLGKQLASLNPLVWVIIACYSLSMALLGVAGVLHKRRR